MSSNGDLPNKIQLNLLGTEACHLCDDAQALIHAELQALGVSYVLSLEDISENDGMIERYGLRIPVLQHGKTELDWPFSREDLLRIINA